MKRWLFECEFGLKSILSVVVIDRESALNKSNRLLNFEISHADFTLSANLELAQELPGVLYANRVNYLGRPELKIPPLPF